MKSIDVAKLFLLWARRDGDLITNLKMQKLLYYAQAWHLVFFKRQLFSDAIEAWSFGPVVPEAYRFFKRYKAAPISCEGNDISGELTKNQMQFLNDFYGKFIGLSAHELVNISHSEDPWRDAFHKRGPSSIITNESMRSFYGEKLRQSRG